MPSSQAHCEDETKTYMYSYCGPNYCDYCHQQSSSYHDHLIFVSRGHTLNFLKWKSPLCADHPFTAADGDPARVARG